MRSGIYRIINIQTNDLYVGSAVDLVSRKAQHLHRLRRGTHHSRYLQRAFNKYGESSFVFEVIEYVGRDRLLEREQYYIDALKPRYNSSPIAAVNVPSQEAIEHLRAINTGKRHTDETRAKISQQQRGKPSNNKGKTFSDESRNKLKEAWQRRKESNANTPIPEGKVCKGCGQFKPLDDFSYQAGCKYNRNPRCKACKKIERAGG